MAANMGNHGLFYVVLFMYTVLPSMAYVSYTVGDIFGWTTNVDYDMWLYGKTFFVGDGLEFNYVGGHTVDEVSQSDYETCTIGNPIISYSSGSTSIPLTAAGTRYFICGVPGHCNNGMKLAVTVVAAPTTTTPPTSPSGSGAAGFFPVLSPPPCTSVTAPNKNMPPPGDHMTYSSSGALSPLIALVSVTWVALYVFLF